MHYRHLSERRTDLGKVEPVVRSTSALSNIRYKTGHHNMSIQVVIKDHKYLLLVIKKKKEKKYRER